MAVNCWKSKCQSELFTHLVGTAVAWSGSGSLLLCPGFLVVPGRDPPISGRGPGSTRLHDLANIAGQVVAVR
jgi:hypothetical protein